MATVCYVVVGCGCPGRGMGWFHCRQLLEGRVPNATLTDIVEPWFLGPGAGSPGSSEFAAFREEAESKHGVRFWASVGEMPAATGRCRVALIAARAGDCPKLFEAAIASGVQHIYLEKPGAPSVAAMESMAALAESQGVGVTMGYNKNVASYVTAAREFETSQTGSEPPLTCFIHNNAYVEEELDECFERNSEGMLKNMAVHELALAVTYCAQLT